MENVTRIATTLLIGWGLGWLVARSVVLEPARHVIESVYGQTRNLWSMTLGQHLALGRIRYVTLPGALTHPAVAFAYGLIHCAACSGFWIGLALARAGWGLGPTWGAALETGVAIMGANALIDSWLSANLARAGQ